MNKNKTSSFLSLCTVFLIGTGVGAFALHASASIQFPDVRTSDYFATAAGDMSQLGFITGYENGNFGPNDPVTRGQVAVIMRRMWQELENQGVVDPVTGSRSAHSTRSTRSTASLSSSVSSSSVSTSSVNTNGSFRFTIDSLSIIESAPNVSVSVIRTGGNEGTASVTYETKNGTATGGEDFTINSGSLQFADGESTKTISVSLKDDENSEGSESFTIVLSDPTSGAAVISPDTVTVTITDNESSNNSDSSSSTAAGEAGRLEFSAAGYSMAEDGGKAVITIVRTEGTSGEVTVEYATSNGTAKSSAYDSTNGTLTFANGDTSKTFEVPLKDNSDINGNKTVNLTLANPTGGAVLGEKSVVLTIIDDEIIDGGNGTFKFDDDQYDAIENDEEVKILVVRQKGFEGEVTIDYDNTPGSAKTGSDYEDTSGTLTFKAGESSKYIMIPIIKDSNKENNENFTMQISNPTGGAITGTPTNTMITISD